jgi:hypothetical protein
MKKHIGVIIILLFVVALIGSGGLVYFYIKNKSESKINSFSDCAAKGYPIMEIYPERCTTPGGQTFVKDVPSQEITVVGEFTCLPHKQKDGPQTAECAFGLKDNSGDHYALSDPNFKYTMSLATGKTITVTGLFKGNPANNNYDTIGTIEITSIQ